MMESKFSYKDYSEILRSDLDKFMLTNPMFIPIPENVTPFLLKDNIIYCPTLKAADNSVCPKHVEKLAKRSKFVIYTEDEVLGTDEFVICDFLRQPREKSPTWIIADYVDDKLLWFKEYGKSVSIIDLFASYLVTRIDSIGNEKAVTDYGIDIYHELFKEVLGFSWLKRSPFENLFELNAARDDSPFYIYNLRKLFTEVI